MILRLVKRDPAWHMALPLALVIGVAAAPSASGPEILNSMELVSVAGLGCLLFARPHVRATLFEAALPITGRDLFLARALSLLAIVWLPVLCGVTVILLVRPDSPRALAMVEAATILTAAILLPQAIRVREIAGPQLWSRFWGVLVWVTGVLAWYFLTPATVLGVFGLASVGVLVRTWFAVPPSLQVVSLKTVDPIAVPESVLALPLARTAFTWLPVLRSAFWWGPAVFFSTMVFEGMSRFGGYFFLFCMVTVLGTHRSRQRTRWLSALPLSCRARLGITLVSAVVPLLAGLAVGMCIGSFHVDHSMPAGPRLQTPMAINVPLEFWHYVPKGNAPVIRAPWGETVQPATFRVVGFTFYNPYSVGPGNGHEFDDWQFARATEAVYGRSIPSAQNGAAQQAGLKPLTDRPRTRLLTWEAAALLSLFLVFATELTRWHVLHRATARVKVILMSILFGMPIVAACGIEMYYMDSVSIGQALVHFVLLRATSALPNSLMAVGAAAVPVWAMYWLLERQFSRSELTMWKRPGQPE